MNAAMRELKEETDLTATEARYLFDWDGSNFRDKSGRLTYNQHKVFLIKADGTARPRHEVRRIAYWRPESKVVLAKTTNLILERYWNEFRVP